MAQFLVQRTGDGKVFFQLHDADGSALLRSSTMRTDEVATAAINWLKVSIVDDWRYLVRAVRRGGPLFSLSMPGTRVVCTSPEFMSSDAMEHAIVSLKAMTPLAPIVYVADVDPDQPDKRLEALRSLVW